MRSTTPQERATVVALAGLVMILLLVHLAARGGPGPGVFSPTAIRADQDGKRVVLATGRYTGSRMPQVRLSRFGAIPLGLRRS